MPTSHLDVVDVVDGCEIPGRHGEGLLFHKKCPNYFNLVLDNMFPIVVSCFGKLTTMTLCFSWRFLLGWIRWVGRVFGGGCKKKLDFCPFASLSSNHGHNNTNQMNKPVLIGLSMSSLLLSWGGFLEDTSTNHPKSIYCILGGFGIHLPVCRVLNPFQLAWGGFPLFLSDPWNEAYLETHVVPWLTGTCCVASTN